MGRSNIAMGPGYAPSEIIASMKFEAADNFIMGNSLCRDQGEPVYDAKTILDLVPMALETCRSKVEKVNIREQEFLAAVNLGNLALAERIFKKLSKMFPPSKYRKARAYEGFMLELEKNYEKAKDLYTPLDGEVNFYPLFRKRLIALSLADGCRKTSIALLVEYLDIMAQDNEAWSQLAKLYLYESMYMRAAFCYEELMIINIHNHVLCSRYADVVYTLGRPDLAIKYYCKSIVLYPDYLHALYGLYSSTKLLLSMEKDHGARQLIQSSHAFSKDPVSYDKEKIEKLNGIAYNRIKSLHTTHSGRPSSGTARAVCLWLDLK